MNLYILRHAIALDHSEWKKADSDRPLSEDGIRKMKKAAKGIRRMGLQLDWILTSPFRRAYDTAQIVAKEFKLEDKLKVTKMLAVGGDSKALVRHLGLNFRSWESVLLVGHQPSLGQLIGTLVTDNQDLDLEFDKGSLAKLSSDSLTYGRCACLEWVLTAKILKKLL